MIKTRKILPFLVKEMKHILFRRQVCEKNNLHHQIDLFWKLFQP